MSQKPNKYQQPFKILRTPTIVNTKDVKPSRGAIIKEANNEFYITDEMVYPFAYGFFGVLMLGAGIFALRYAHVGFWSHFRTYGLIVLGAFFLFYRLTVKKKHKQFVLDRLNGVVSYPDSFYGKPLKGKFSELKAVISVSGDIDGAPGKEYLKFVNTFRPRKLDILRTVGYGNPYEQWSLFVWYMDKNRPLPPGTAFDSYRSQDFERRKAEGFPRPLYKSNISTPEATKEQRAERMRIGGW